LKETKEVNIALQSALAVLKDMDEKERIETEGTANCYRLLSELLLVNKSIMHLNLSETSLNDEVPSSRFF
jgi:hypothetical protein